MTCNELMKKDVLCFLAGDSVATVAKGMRARNIGFVPICDESGGAIGVLTDRDLALRVVGEGRPIATTVAADVMSAEVVSCKPTDELSVAEQLMVQHRKSRIVCVDDKKHPVGVISLSDVAIFEPSGRAGALLRSLARREAEGVTHV